MTAAAHQERLMTVLQGPLFSEKSTLAAELNNQIVFKVRPDATKREIREAVELLFEVYNEATNTLIFSGETSSS